MAKKNLLNSFPMYIRVLNYSFNNRCLFFRRLKINHESHEFILDHGTVANSNDVINEVSHVINIVCFVQFFGGKTFNKLIFYYLLSIASDF